MLEGTAQGRRYRAGKVLRFFLTTCLVIQGCASLPERVPLPEDKYAESLVLGSSQIRFWGDRRHPAATAYDAMSAEELQRRFPKLVSREVHILALSGGGDNGAFAAGLLKGWAASGSRPEFTAVTGISTGALIAPFAFLGPAYDDRLEHFYTQHATSDLIERRAALQVIRSDAIFDTNGLRAIIERNVDETLMRAIAEEYRQGRLLYIGTTNLDAGRPVSWDIGAIASSGQPGALELIRSVMLASASIPGAFPPVLIEVESGGKRYDEMHVDGGASRQTFLFNLSSDADAFRRLNPTGKGHVYIIRNAKLAATWEAVERRTLAIAGRSASSMIRTQGIGDLYREYLGAQKYGLDFHLAYIPGDFDAETHELFDRNYMLKLFQLGYDMAAQGYPWESYPPGLTPL